MRTVHIVHPDLDLEARVPPSTARVLAATGWVEASDPVEREASDENSPDEGLPANLPDPGDLRPFTEED